MRIALALLLGLIMTSACAPNIVGDKDQFIEAESESVSLMGQARRADTMAAFSGSGYVEIPQRPRSGIGDIAIASINSQDATLRLWYATSPWVGTTMGPDGPIETDFFLDIYVDGALQRTVDLEAASVWTVKDVPLKLRRGENTLSMMAATKNAGNLQIDRLSVVFAD